MAYWQAHISFNISTRMSLVPQIRLTKDLIVFSAPVAVIDVGNVCKEDVVTFIESSNIPNNLSGGSIVNWDWFFGEATNGSSGPIAEPQYQYLTAGQKDMSLEVLTDQGCRDIATKQIVIGEPPTADFSWTEFCEGDSTQFESLATAEFGVPNSFNWEFDDGQVSTDENPAHKYAQFGVYDVKFTVGTDAGCSSDITKQVYIQDSIKVFRDRPYATNFESGGARGWLLRMELPSITAGYSGRLMVRRSTAQTRALMPGGQVQIANHTSTTNSHL